MSHPSSTRSPAGDKEDRKKLFYWGALLTLASLAMMAAAVGLDKGSHGSHPPFALGLLFSFSAMSLLVGILLMLRQKWVLKLIGLGDPKDVSPVSALAVITMAIIFLASRILYDLIWYSFCVSRP